MFDCRYFKLFVCCLTVCYFSAVSVADDVPVCLIQTSCSCQFTNGSMIDISSLGNKNGSARFLNVPSTNASENYSYSYNPCYAFTLENTNCKNVAVCQMEKNGGSSYSLGGQGSASFYMNGSQLTLNYTDQDRTASVKLICDNTGTTSLTVDGEYMIQHYSFTLRSPCACPNGCLSAANQDDKLSTGSVLVILLFIFVLCYVLGGIIFQKIMKGATGRELVPNYEFWMDFPLLVRDGVIFTCNGCQNDINYDRI